MVASSMSAPLSSEAAMPAATGGDGQPPRARRAVAQALRQQKQRGAHDAAEEVRRLD